VWNKSLISQQQPHHFNLRDEILQCLLQWTLPQVALMNVEYEQFGEKEETN
jgi:hypothetical protein